MLLTTIFYEIDEFCKQFEPKLKTLLITSATRTRRRKSNLSMSEVMTICVFFHHSGYKNFKEYYTNYVQKYLSTAFNRLVSYNRFVD